ncbi:MAG: hypothetical protein LBV43_05050 [Prevotella sp.]|nr:hypothetical protein [Prevotella sp.]
MDKKELDSYRLTSLEEPTDEQLSTIMEEVAQEAKEKSEAAHRKLFQKIAEKSNLMKAEWRQKYNLSYDNPNS